MNFLKYISIPELNISKSWSVGWNKFGKLSKFEKYITFFWFLGPFIYLIERDPADLWLTLLSLIFIIKCFIDRNWKWTTQLWFKCAIVLWLFGLFSAILSPDPLFSFTQGFVWIRFPLYAAAAQVWLARDRDIRVIMFISILVGMLLMCAILIAETIIEPKTRLTWPFGDLVPGSYISKFSLPVFCTLIAIAMSAKNKAGYFSGIIALLSIFVSALTGERTNFLIRACSGFLAGIVWRPKLKLFLILIIFELFAVIILAVNRPDFRTRFSTNFFKSIPVLNTTDTNPYWGAWRAGIQQGLISPILGTGPSGTRNTCKFLNTNEPKWLPGKNFCSNHPHNFYVQLFAETGIIGLLLGSLMFGSITYSCYKARNDNPNCPMKSTAFIVPLALFFPIQQFGSFYGQWGNLFIWFAIAFAISEYQSWEKS